MTLFKIKLYTSIPVSSPGSNSDARVRGATQATVDGHNGHETAQQIKAPGDEAGGIRSNCIWNQQNRIT